MSATATQFAFDQLETSKNVSQLIRSNAPSYWTYMKDGANLECLTKYLPFAGIIAGDPHPGNFGPIPVRTMQGQRVMKFVNIDFDDCGRGPFVLDYVRYVIAVKADSKQSTWRTLQEAYVAGLMGKKATPPPKVRNLLAMKLSAYDEKAFTYVARKTTAKGFKFKKGEVERYDNRIDPTAIVELFPSESVAGLANRIEARGGSANELRIWVLVANGGARRIVELKQHSTPGTACYCLQPSVKQWLAQVRRAFWPGLDGSAYDLITVGGELFWIRDKHLPLIDIPYSSRKARDRKFVVDLALYDANLLGRAHGIQPSARRYLQAILKDPEEFRQATKLVGKAYLTLAEEALQRR